MSINKIGTNSSSSSEGSPATTPPLTTTTLSEFAIARIERTPPINDPCETSDRSSSSSPFSTVENPSHSISIQSYPDPWTGEPLDNDEASVFYPYLTNPGTPISPEGTLTSNMLVQKATELSGTIVSNSIKIFNIPMNEPQRQLIIQQALQATKCVIIKCVKEAIENGCGDSGLGNSCINLAWDIGSKLSSQAFQWIRNRASIEAEKALERALESSSYRASSLLEDITSSQLYNAGAHPKITFAGDSTRNNSEQSRLEYDAESLSTITTRESSILSLGTLVTSNTRMTLTPTEPQPPSINTLEARLQQLTLEESKTQEKSKNKRQRPKLKLQMPSADNAPSSSYPSPFHLPLPHQDQGTSLRSNFPKRSSHGSPHPYANERETERPSYLTWGADQFSSFMHTTSMQFQQQLANMHAQTQQSLALIANLNQQQSQLCSEQNTMLSRMAMSSVPNNLWIPEIHNNPTHVANRQAQARFYSAAPQSPIIPQVLLRNYTQERKQQQSTYQQQDESHYHPGQPRDRYEATSARTPQGQQPPYSQHSAYAPPFGSTHASHYHPGQPRDRYEATDARTPYSQQDPYSQHPDNIERRGTYPYHQPHAQFLQSNPELHSHPYEDEEGASGFPSGINNPGSLMSHPNQRDYPAYNSQRRGSEPREWFCQENPPKESEEGDSPTYTSYQESKY